MKPDENPLTKALIEEIASGESAEWGKKVEAFTNWYSKLSHQGLLNEKRQITEAKSKLLTLKKKYDKLEDECESDNIFSFKNGLFYSLIFLSLTILSITISILTEYFLLDSTLDDLILQIGIYSLFGVFVSLAIATLQRYFFGQ